jgi:glycosyltransferase involved in cell wall biosynthesis
VLTSDRGARQHDHSAEAGVARTLRSQPQYDARLSPAAQFLLTRRNAEAHNRRELRAMVKEFHPDIVFIWNLQGLPQELAIDAERSDGVAVAFWLAGYTPAETDSFWRYWTQPPQQRSALSGIKEILGRAALAQMRREGKPVRPQMRHVAVVSEYMREKGLAEGTLPSNAEVIYNGVETERFFRPVPVENTQPPLRLLLAGRIGPDKGTHVALEAISQLVKLRPQRDFQLVIAGSGAREFLEQLGHSTSSYGLTDLVSFLGWIPREEVCSLMHTCHILLLPSNIEEAFARVPLEAMAAGLAVIGTLTGGTGELLRDNGNGLVFEAGNSEALAFQINRLLDDSQLRYRLACEGQAMVLQKFRLSTMVDRIEGFLERAIAEQSS